MGKSDKKTSEERNSEATRSKSAKIAENTASFGLLLLAVALLVPLFNMFDMELISIFKWVYASGAIIYTGARVAGVRSFRGSPRMRRLRRMEFWGGVAFILAAAFWFYQEDRALPYTGALAILNETIVFSLVGAAIQVIASWMIYFVGRREGRSGELNKDNRKKV